jgi:hypothetical protein
VLKHVAATRGNPVIIENTKRLNAAERALALGSDKNGNPVDLSPQFYREFVTSVANTIAPGSTAEAQIEALAAKTLGQQAANWKQYIFQHPEEAGVKEFVRQGLETLRREHAVIKAQNRKLIAESIPAMAPTLKRYPSAWNIYKPAGLGPESVDPETFQLKNEIDPVAEGHAAASAAAGTGPAGTGVKVQIKGKPETAKTVTPEQAAKFLQSKDFERAP